MRFLSTQGSLDSSSLSWGHILFNDFSIFGYAIKRVIAKKTILCPMTGRKVNKMRAKRDRDYDAYLMRLALTLLERGIFYF